MGVYENVKRRCTEKNISILALEKDCGFSLGSICKWDVSIPRADRLQKVADRLGCTSAELLKEDDA